MGWEDLSGRRGRGQAPGRKPRFSPVPVMAHTVPDDKGAWVRLIAEPDDRWTAS